MAFRDTLRTGRALVGLAPALPAALRYGVCGVVRRRARLAPRAPMLRDPWRTWTAAEVDAAADRVGSYWRARGVGPGDVVAVASGNDVEVLLQQLGLARIGAAAALLSTALRGAPLAHALRICGARAVVADPDALARLRGVDGPPAQRVAEAAEGWRSTPPDPLDPLPQDGDAVFCFLFTSGTTGLPKAAPIRHRRLLAAGAGIHGFGAWLTERDTVFTPLPLHHASAQLMGIGAALAAGACFAFAPRFRASSYWRDARAAGATVGLYVGEMCRYLLAAPPQPDERGHGVHTFVGNGLRADVWTRFQARFGGPRIVEFYGATEGNAFLVNRNGKVGSCGRPVFPAPLDNLRLVRVQGEGGAHPRGRFGRLQRCADGEVGELVGRIGWSPFERFDGYVDSDATESKVLRDGPFGRCFRTGDLLRRDAEGDYFFVDRRGETFRWKGENVSTQEVAEVLAACRGVEAVAVYGVEVPGCEGRAGMAAVAGAVDPADLYASAARSLAPWARPVFLRACPDLERTETMKLRRQRLAEEGFTRCGADPVWLLRPGGYVLLDAARLDALQLGEIRL